jgi:hypothetical protein
MAVDIELWAILVAMAAFIACGCIVTWDRSPAALARHRKRAGQH